ncbi:MAG TPA: ATP-binding protein [Candidatus Paceibacterota bacterium]
MGFQLSVPFLFSLSMILTFFASWILGFFILITAFKYKMPRAFGRLVLIVSIWAISHFLWQSTFNSKLAIFFSQLGIICAILISVFFVDFVTRFVESLKPEIYDRTRRFFYSVAIALVMFVVLDIIGVSQFFILGNTPKIWFLLWPVPGPALGLFFLFSGVAFMYGFWMLYKIWHGAERIVKIQLLFIFISVMFAIIGIFINYLLWYDIVVPPLGGLLIPFFVLGLFYGITKHHLFNIRIIATELFIFAIWTFLFVRILLAVSFEERIFDAGMFAIIFLFGLSIIRSVWNEVAHRERSEALSRQLDKANAKLRDLNVNLQDKVDQQTKEIKKAYEVEKKARIELEEIDKAKDEFILTMQHHLRTPLTIIKGYLHMTLAKKLMLLDGEAKTYLNKIAEGIERISRLINELLDISELKAGENVLKTGPTNIKSILEDIRLELISEIERKKIKYEIHFENGAENLILNIDAHKLKEALYNILDNAVKYTEQGSVITLCSIVSDSHQQKAFRISIQDTGIGIPKEELPIIFEHYFQRGRLARAINIAGRGIGLLLSKKIIELHKGTIQAESGGEGKGATFIITLPCA